MIEEWIHWSITIGYCSHRNWSKEIPSERKTRQRQGERNKKKLTKLTNIVFSLSTLSLDVFFLVSAIHSLIDKTIFFFLVVLRFFFCFKKEFTKEKEFQSLSIEMRLKFNENFMIQSIKSSIFWKSFFSLESKWFQRISIWMDWNDWNNLSELDSNWLLKFFDRSFSISITENGLNFEN